MAAKAEKSIHNIILFFTPVIIDQYFEFLSAKTPQKRQIESLLVGGGELPNLLSESHAQDRSLPDQFPAVKLSETGKAEVVVKEKNLEAKENLSIRQKLKQFSRQSKKSKIHRACIIDKKAA